MSPTRLLLVLLVLGAIGGLLGGVWAYGEGRFNDGKAAKQAEYKAAADKKNVDLDDYSNVDDALSAIADAALNKHIAEAEQVVGGCPATEEQAAAITRIRRSK